MIVKEKTYANYYNFIGQSHESLKLYVLKGRYTKIVFYRPLQMTSYFQNIDKKKISRKFHNNSSKM